MVSVLMLGNQAIAQGAYEAGVKVVTAYPGTPSTEITESAAEFEEIYVEWSPNEKVALEVAIGASMGGARAMACMKHVGLNVAADPLFTVSYTGVNGGLVIVVADDPGMHSSQNEQDTRHYGRGAQIPILEPSDSQEARDYVLHAFQISEEYDTPVIVRVSTRISHAQSLVDSGTREEIGLREYTKDFQKYVMMPGMARKRHMVVEDRMKRLAEASNGLEMNQIERGDSSIGIITSGICYQYAKEALPEASYLKLGMVNPLPQELILQFSKEVRDLYVIEELDPIIEEQIKSLCIPVKGKELFSIQGEYTPSMIEQQITGKKRETLPPAQVPLRPPVLCPGCPHRGVFYLLHKLKLHVTGDIGCYTLGALPPLESLDSCVCMGASIGMALGMEKARGREFAKGLVAVIGDSTFIHSGITPLIDVVYNGGISTVIIVDNSTTGMTGHQDHPGTGFTAKGEEAPILNLEALVRAIGIEHVHVVDPFNLSHVEELLKEETTREEPSVIIAKSSCILLSKKREETLVYTINEEVCKRCKRCLALGCPAIESGEVIRINSSLCNGCGLCHTVCRFSAVERE